MAASAISESLAYQAAATDSLLRKLHQGCSGLNSKYHPVTFQLVSTYPDIERKLTKSFPEHPGTLDLVKVGVAGPVSSGFCVITLIQPAQALHTGRQAGFRGTLEAIRIHHQGAGAGL